jgi:uncharacterized protein YwqG
MTGTNLSGANLEGTNLSSSELSRANFSGANLTGAILDYSRLNGANLENAILKNVDLNEVVLTGCIMPDGTLDQPYERVMNAIGYMKRSAWIPVIKEGDGDLRNSKFGGKPWLNNNEQWPICSNCGNPMRFFFQINLQEIPTELNDGFGNGILQLFYCTNEAQIEHDFEHPETTWSERSPDGNIKYIQHKSCEIECFSSQPFSLGQLVRIVQIEGIPAEFDIPPTGECTSMIREGEFPPKLIVNWREIDNYPDGAEIEIHKVNLSPNDLDFFYDIDKFQEADQLAGWARWVQDKECPDCPVCKVKMEQLVFQLSSDSNLPFLWGDAGIGYIFQCSDHKSQVAFLWQC